jgi:hypothetical protein
MNMVAAVESQNIELERKIVWLKVSRNALTPFGRLPSDVILQVMRHTASGTGAISKDVFVLGFVCSQLRSMLLGMP